MDGKHSAGQVAVFARHPEPGRCKTRIAAVLGDPTALRIYERLLSHTLALVRASGYPACLWVTPDERAGEASSWAPGFASYRAQGAGDLGARLFRAVESAFAENHGKVLLIGTDCPELTASHLEQAFTALDRADAVIGPTRDGGYYLLGLKKAHVFLFENIPWSTAETAEATVMALKRNNLSYICLPELTDIDTADDFLRFKHRPLFKAL